MAFALASIDCVRLDAYVCARDEDCLRGDEFGVCEPARYCSYEDGDCDSGRRYSELAGELANECTDAPATTSATGSPTGEPTSGSAGSGGGDPLCGDGTRDDGEECDDGNDGDGDGCNADCVRSGALLWSVAVAGSAGEIDSGQAITRLASGGIVATGWLHDAATDDDVWVARYDADGAQLWANTVGGPADQDDRGLGIAQASSADLFVGGYLRDADSRDASIFIVTPAGELVETLDISGTDVHGVSAFGDSVVVVGESSGGGFVEAVGLLGDSVWREQGADGEDRFFGVQATGSQDAFVVGQSLGNAWLGRATPTGLVTIDARDGSAADLDLAQAVVVGEQRVFAAGLLVTDAAPDIWIAGYDIGAAGPPAWESAGCIEPSPVQQAAVALAIEPSGDLIAGGYTTLDDRDAWLARLTVDGDCVWGRAYPEFDGDSAITSVAVDPSGRMYVAGEITGDDGSIDAWVAAFAP